MNKKITILNESNLEVGKTYQKRARQLVKKNRAIWLKTDTICLIDYKEDFEMDSINNTPIPNRPVEEESSTNNIEGYKIIEKMDEGKYNISRNYTDEELFELAKIRVTEKRNLLMHGALFFIGLIIMGNLSYIPIIGFFLQVIIIVWSLVLVLHVASYLTAVTPERVEKQYNKLRKFENRRKFK